MIYIGIDPGTSGGIGVIDLRDDPVYVAHPFKNINLYWLAAFIEDYGDTMSAVAMIEKVHAMPGQGVVSTFNFGMSFGMLEGFLIGAGVPYERVTPQKWQKGYGLYKKPGETKTEKKNRHKALAQELFPDLKITHATADALLIAEYARRMYVKE